MVLSDFFEKLEKICLPKFRCPIDAGRAGSPEADRIVVAVISNGPATALGSEVPSNHADTAQREPPSKAAAKSRFAPRTRESLLSRLRDASDDGSWSEFYYTYWDLIFRCAVKYGLSNEQAEEVVQDTLVALVGILPKFKYDRSKGSFKSWLMTQTRWKVLDFQRRLHARDSSHFADPEEIGVDNFHEYWEAEWKKAILQMALERLKNSVSPHLIQLFGMCVLEERGAAETARMLRVSRASVHMAVFKVKRLCKREIRRLESEGF
jgi:RNA polymerase sigma factor (sigma-70 family)